MTAISIQLPEINLSRVTPQQFLQLSNDKQTELIKAKDSGQPFWLIQVKAAIKDNNRLRYFFLTPNRADIDAMDSILNNFSK